MGSSLSQQDVDSGVATVETRCRERASLNGKMHVNHNDLKFECTPLAYALIKRYEDVVMLLLQRGADANAPAGFKATLGLKPIHIATALDMTSMVEALLLHGADINAGTDPGNFFGPSTGSIVGPSFSNISVGDRALHIAVILDRPAVLDVLLQRRPNLNATNSKGRTALYKAAKHGHIELVDVLLAHRADVHAGGSPAVFAAIKSTSSEMVQRFISAGTSMTCHNEDRATPLQYAVTFPKVFFSNRDEIVKILAQAGSDVDQLVPPKTAEGMRQPMTLLDYAEHKRWPRVTTALVHCRAHRFAQLPTARQEALRQSAQPQNVGGTNNTTTTRPAPGQPQFAAAPAAVPASAPPAASLKPGQQQPVARPSTAAPPAASTSQADGARTGTCAVCLDAPATMGFVHTATSAVHTCLCDGCAAQLQRSNRLNKCIYCNAPANCVMRVVMS